MTIGYLAPRYSTKTVLAPSRLNQFIKYGILGILSGTIGFYTALQSPKLLGLPAIGYLSDEDSCKVYRPESDQARLVENYIETHPVVAELRKNPTMIESRPHMKRDGRLCATVSC